MKKLLTALIATLLLTSAAYAVDVTFEWEVTGPHDGCTLVIHDRKTGAETRQNVPVGQTTLDVSLANGLAADIWVVAFTDIVNPDGSVVHIESDPSNILDVKTPGRSGNLHVR